MGFTEARMGHGCDCFAGVSLKTLRINGKHSKQRKHMYNSSASGLQTALWPSTMDSDPEEKDTPLRETSRLWCVLTEMLTC